MERPHYHTFDEIFALLYGPYRASCMRLLDDNRARFEQAPGSRHNHQTWIGGYLDHVREALNYAILIYHAEMATGRPMPFRLDDALVVIFLHDLEKPWLYDLVDGEWRKNEALQGKAARAAFRWMKIAEYGIRLTPEMQNALMYAEGEGDDYRSDRRVANEMAAFVHICDTWSARVRHNYPKAGDPWSGR